MPCSKCKQSGHNIRTCPTTGPFRRPPAPTPPPPPPTPDTAGTPTIEDFIPNFLRAEKIYTREDLDSWCKDMGAKTWGKGFRRDPLYAHTQEKCPIHYSAIKHPKSTIRANYEMYLSGFKIKSKSL